MGPPGDDQQPPSLVGKVVLPGDAVADIPESGQVRIGAGLKQQGDSIVTLKAGLAQQTTTGKLWIQGTQKRYMPARDDLVVGTVTDRHGENFAVDIRGPFPATLPMLSFEGASRRNRPNVSAGDVVYCRVEEAHRDIDPTLSCVDTAGKANGLGVLKEGYVFTCSTYLARRLLARPVCAVLEALGTELKFEMAVGMNGQVWVSSDSAETTIIVSNAIIASEFKSDSQARQTVKALLKMRNKA